MQNIFLIQLNELNFEIISKYLSDPKNRYRFHNFKKITTEFKSFKTYGEEEYENLEPWIQWTSVNLGKKFKDHKIFRLGDIVRYKEKEQIFEKIEKKGFKVGAISPMNVDNRLESPSYFIPDPWTDTMPDKSNFSFKLSKMLKQSVNDNASSKLTTESIITLLQCIIVTLNLKRSFFLIKLIITSLLKPWKKALVLDYLIHLIHIRLYNKTKPNFSSVFFNAGAHIQHHYLFNSKYINNIGVNPVWYIKQDIDPLEDMLDVYDKILGDYLKLNANIKLILATGLRQVPYNKIKFYYRLKNHTSFLRKLGLNFKSVLPRMTRDFEIIFDNDSDKNQALEKLKILTINNKNIHIFGDFEVRNDSIFLSLTYPNEIFKDDYLFNGSQKINLYDEVVFVAIKNGMHDKLGYVYISEDLNVDIPNNIVHVSYLHDFIYELIT